jgi:hypothetical protein
MTILWTAMKAMMAITAPIKAPITYANISNTVVKKMMFKSIFEAVSILEKKKKPLAAVKNLNEKI